MNKISIFAGVMALGLGANAMAAGTTVSSLASVPATQQVINFESEDGHIIGGSIPGADTSWSALGLTFTADDQFTVGQYVSDLSQNGLWGGNGNHFLSFDKLGSMALTVSFGGLKTSGFAFDYSIYEENAAGGASLTVEAFDINGLQLGSYSTSVAPAFGLDTYNQFSTTGWVESSASIASIRISGDGVVLDNLTFTTPVPEASTYAMLLAGLGLMGFLARRRKA